MPEKLHLGNGTKAEKMETFQGMLILSINSNLQGWDSMVQYPTKSISFYLPLLEQ